MAGIKQVSSLHSQRILGLVENIFLIKNYVKKAEKCIKLIQPISLLRNELSDIVFHS